jgi:hypothetical protein
LTNLQSNAARAAEEAAKKDSNNTNTGRKIIENLVKDKRIRQNVGEILTKSSQVSRQAFLTVLRAVVQYAEQRQKIQEDLLAVLKDINSD